MPRLRLPVELAMFSAGVGVFLLFFGTGMGFYVVYAQGGLVFPWWCLGLAAGGLGIFVATALVYFLRLIQFVRQSGIRYNSFFWNLPIESADHPESAGEMIDAGLETLEVRWPGVTVVLFAFIPILKYLGKIDAARALLHTDLGAIHNGGTHWDVEEVVVLGGGAVLLVFILALAVRRIWAMQRFGPPPK